MIGGTAVRFPAWATPEIELSIERQIEAVVFDLIFRPVVDVIRSASYQARNLRLNARGDALRVALRSGRIQYDPARGIFSGPLSGALSLDLEAIGATFDARSKVYRLDAHRIPAWVASEAAHYQLSAKAAHGEIQRTLDDLQVSIDDALAKRNIDAGKVGAGVQKNWQLVGNVVGIRSELSPEARERVEREYVTDLTPEIKKFADETILRLRDEVSTNAEEGARFDVLVERIKKRYGVAKSKARFLARQETALFMAKRREARFADVGVSEYRWSTSHDGKVRDAHAHLDGKVFSYASPPIVDLATGRRANPGQDFNCRCTDIPILPTASLRQKEAA